LADKENTVSAPTVKKAYDPTLSFFDNFTVVPLKM
jgi:hypothetical protein